MFGGIQSTLNAKICLFCKIRFLRSAPAIIHFSTNSTPNVLISRLELIIYSMSPTRKMFLTRNFFVKALLVSMVAWTVSKAPQPKRVSPKAPQKKVWKFIFLMNLYRKSNTFWWFKSYGYLKFEGELKDYNP